MARDLSNQQWHGIPRKEIPWYPTIDPEKCIGCELCFVTCGREVYDITPDKYHKARVVRPYNCMVGCSTCAMVCPTQAISFPDRDMIWKLEREHKIFKLVHEEARVKKEKMNLAKSRENAEQQVAKAVTRARFEVAGGFGEKRFLMQLKEFIANKPIDIVNVTMEVPTLQDTSREAPGYMRFEVTSIQKEDIQAYLEALRSLIKENQLVLINETHLT